MNARTAATLRKREGIAPGSETKRLVLFILFLVCSVAIHVFGMTSIVFSVMHGGATYLTPVAVPFIVTSTFTLGLACGYLITKTDSISGATLIDAASDLFLFVAILASA